MRSESSDQPLEFRDTRPWFQYAMGGVAGAGLVATVTLIKSATKDNPAFLTLAGVVAIATVVTLAVIYFRYGQTVVLRVTPQGIERTCGEKRQLIAYEQLAGFRSKWTDVLRNGVYQYTQVALEFLSEDQAAPIMKSHASADYGTPKFEQLQEFQESIAAVVADRMADRLEEKGRVTWTSRLAILPQGIEFTKREGAPPELIDFERVSQWKTDQGLFKLGVDGGKKPHLVEKTSEWNFHPGLLLFSRLCDSPGSQSTIGDELHYAVG
jgi:hypothetical protein